MKRKLTVMGLIAVPLIYSVVPIAVPKVVSVLIFISDTLVGFQLLAALGAAAGALAFGQIDFRSFLIAIL